MLMWSVGPLTVPCYSANRPQHVNTQQDNLHVTFCLECGIMEWFIEHAMYIWLRPKKHRVCNRPGRPFCDKACNRIGASCDKSSQYSTQRPATKVCNTGGRDKQGVSAHSSLNTYIDMYIYI